MSVVDANKPPSILFDRLEDCSNAQSAGPPIAFVDLNLDQVVDAVTAEWAGYDLQPFFYYSLRLSESVSYRHEVFRDLENAALYERIRAFAASMRDVRGHLQVAAKFYYQYQKEAWFLHAVERYCDTIAHLAADLSSLTLSSRGFTSLKTYVVGYAASNLFKSLVNETNVLKDDLAEVKYCILINGDTLTVRNCADESNYSAEIEATFEKFKQGAVSDYRVTYRFTTEMNHIEAKVLEFVAQLNPDLFSRLDAYCIRHAHFIDETIATFDREVHFYIAYLEHIAKFKARGLSFCYPQVSTTTKAVHAREAFDLGLAQKLADANATIVCNDFALQDPERIIVVTGPNQGGKTTFARMFAQLHYLASLGCPVPGRAAHLFLFDQLFTHFEREEKVESLRGKLEDDLTRVHAILRHATPNSIIVMNEVFTSATVQDELFLSQNVIRRLDDLDVLCVWVTFLDELASFGHKTVSMVSTIAPDNPTLRTFKVVRRPADGLAYAMAIAEKYRVTYDCVKERIAS